MRWVGNITHAGDKKNVYRVLMRKPERKKPLERPKCSWEDNMKVYLKEI
jgi:hypothetical protein